MSYYIYTHTRKDTNKIFYIGFSKKYGDYFGRANQMSHARRNPLWCNIYNKCKKDIQIDIIFETDCKDIALQEEKRLITLHGKIIDGKGALSNIADGGQATKNAMKVSQYSLEGIFIKTWKGVPEIINKYDVSLKAIYNVIGKNNKSSVGFLWAWWVDDSKVNILPYVSTKYKKISQYSLLGDYIKTFKSLSDASLATQIDRASINNCALGKRKSCGGFLWAYPNKTVVLAKDCLIYKCDLKTGHKLKAYAYLQDAVKEFNLRSGTAIKNCFTGKQKQAYGFKWIKE